MVETFSSYLTLKLSNFGTVGRSLTQTGTSIKLGAVAEGSRFYEQLRKVSINLVYIYKILLLLVIGLEDLLYKWANVLIVMAFGFGKACG